MRMYVSCSCSRRLSTRADLRYSSVYHCVYTHMHACMHVCVCMCHALFETSVSFHETPVSFHETPVAGLLPVSFHRFAVLVCMLFCVCAHIYTHAHI